MTHLLIRDVVVNPCLKFLPNALRGDGGEVAVGKNGVYDCRVGCLLLWGDFTMSAQAGSATWRKTYETCWLRRREPTEIRIGTSGVEYIKRLVKENPGRNVF